MREEPQQELEAVKRAEQFQGKMISYISTVGKGLMYTLPILLVGLTIIILIIGTYFLLELVFYALLAIYGGNATLLLVGAWSTERSLEMRLAFERNQGRPIESLDGFETLEDGVTRVILLLKVISLLCYISTGLYLGTLLIDILPLAFAAAGFTLFAFGLAVLIQSLNFNIHTVNGLQDFFRPTHHAIKLDSLITESVINHLDPITSLRWDEFSAKLKKVLESSFVKKIKKHEREEHPLDFALEKFLFLYYLLYQDVISKDRFKRELREILTLDKFDFPIEKGLPIEGVHRFSKLDIFQIFDYIKQYNPGFFKIVERLQLELVENITQIAKAPFYIDTCTQERVFKNGALNLMTFLYNNAEEAKEYSIEIIAPGFDPDHIELEIEAEGRGTFEIPKEKVPLVASEGQDVPGLMSTILENSDPLWFTLEPRKTGTQTLQIFLKSPKGRIISGETKTVNVTKDLTQQFKRLTSAGSMIGGIGVGVARILPVIM